MCLRIGYYIPREGHTGHSGHTESGWKQECQKATPTGSVCLLSVVCRLCLLSGLFFFVFSVCCFFVFYFLAIFLAACWPAARKWPKRKLSAKCLTNILWLRSSNALKCGNIVLGVVVGCWPHLCFFLFCFSDLPFLCCILFWSFVVAGKLPTAEETISQQLQHTFGAAGRVGPVGPVGAPPCKTKEHITGEQRERVSWGVLASGKKLFEIPNKAF